jgi:hypothetical protein
MRGGCRFDLGFRSDGRTLSFRCKNLKERGVWISSIRQVHSSVKAPRIDDSVKVKQVETWPPYLTLLTPLLELSPSLQVSALHHHHHSERGVRRDTNVVEGVGVDSTFHSQVSTSQLGDFKYLQSPLLFQRHEEYATAPLDIPSRPEWAIDYKQYPGSGRSQFKYLERPIHRQEHTGNPPLDLPRQFHQYSDPRYEESSLTPHLNSHFPAERRYTTDCLPCSCTHVSRRMFG